MILENNFADEFSKYYEQYVDIYEDDIELAMADFKDFQNMDEYGFITDSISKAGSAVKSAANTTLNVAKSAANTTLNVAKKVGNTTLDVAKKVGNTTVGAAKTVSSGVSNLASNASGAAKDYAIKKAGSVKNYAVRKATDAGAGMATGALINGVRGKSVIKGAATGAGVGLIGGGLIRKGYSKVREQFSSDLSYSEVINNPISKEFASFYAETEDIYLDNMDKAFADFVELNGIESNYFLKDRAKDFINGVNSNRLGRSVS